MRTPLAAGFCRAISPTFDITQRESSDLLSSPMPDLATIAARYSISIRCARNWRKAGVDLSDPLAIAKHLADQKRPSIAAIRKSLEILKSNQ